TATIGELRGLVTKTRPAKRQADAADLVAGWWARARGLGFTPRHLARCVGRRDVLPDRPNDDVIFQVLAGRHGVCAATSVFTRAEVIAAIVDMSVPGGKDARPRPLLLPADEVERVADRFLASDLVVELLPEARRSITAIADEP